MEIYRYFSVFGILAVWGFCGFVILNWFRSKSLSISLHAVAFKKAYFLFATGLTFNGVFFYIFALKWLAPTFNLPEMFMKLFSATLFFQFITALVPDIKGKFSKLHNFSAYAMAVCMPIILSFFINSRSVSAVVKVIATIAILTMIVELILLIFIDKKKSHYLIYQMVYATAFHTALLAITFLG